MEITSVLVFAEKALTITFMFRVFYFFEKVEKWPKSFKDDLGHSFCLKDVPIENK